MSSVPLSPDLNPSSPQYPSLQTHSPHSLPTCSPQLMVPLIPKPTAPLITPSCPSLLTHGIPSTPPNLEDDVGTRLHLEDAAGAKRLYAGVREVGEERAVEAPGSLDMVKHEAKLLGLHPTWRQPLAPHCQPWRLAQHHRVIQHLAALLAGGGRGGGAEVSRGSSERENGGHQGQQQLWGSRQEQVGAVVGSEISKVSWVSSQLWGINSKKSNISFGDSKVSSGSEASSRKGRGQL